MKEYLVKNINRQVEITAGAERGNIWDNADINTDFAYACGDDNPPKTTFMALHDNEYLYFRYEAKVAQVLTFTVEDHKMEVVDSERVELFFCRDKELNPYYCLELDARGRVLDYVTSYYRNFDYEWSWKKGHLNICANEYAGGYVVEGAISLMSLREYGVLKGNEMLTGLFRGYCTALPEAGRKAQLRWISWVNPKIEKPDFHIPEVFGKLIICE